MALVGQISVHGESSQWLHRITPKWREVWGNSPFSMCLTQVRKTPTGTWCSSLHATVQAWHPIHRSWSITNPYRICSASLSYPHALENYFSFDIIADPQPSPSLRRILPAPVGRFRIPLRIGDSDDKFVLHQRARFSCMQKLPLIRNARRIDFIVSDLKPN